MSESTQRQRVIKGLRPLDAVPIENSLRGGVPDVNYIGGWMELKWMRRWPVRATTLARIDHFNRQQRLWLKRRWNRGGDTWLLLQVGHEWLLFDGLTASRHVGLVTRERLYEIARVRWTRGLKDKELVSCLTMGWENWSGSPLVRPSSLTVEEEVRANTRPPSG